MVKIEKQKQNQRKTTEKLPVKEDTVKSKAALEYMINSSEKCSVSRQFKQTKEECCFHVCLFIYFEVEISTEISKVQNSTQKWCAGRVTINQRTFLSMNTISCIQLNFYRLHCWKSFLFILLSIFKKVHSTNINNTQESLFFFPSPPVSLFLFQSGNKTWERDKNQTNFNRPINKKIRKTTYNFTSFSSLFHTFRLVSVFDLSKITLSKSNLKCIIHLIPSE